MGHFRLGKELPQTRSWNKVVEQITGDFGAPAIAASTLKAARKALDGASGDAAFVQSFWLLTQLPRCARSSQYIESLRGVGISVSDPPSLAELIGAFSDAIDAHVRSSGRRTDLGEMAQMGAAESLAADVGRRSKSLFGTTPQDVQRSLARLGTAKQFSGLARDFFARLTERYLGYFLSRELSAHIGRDRRFAGLSEREAFNEALALHCRQASKIVEKFAGDWYSKRSFETGITPEDVSGFIHVALGKIQAEVAKGAHGGH
jgi:hypothetical protein